MSVQLYQGDCLDILPTLAAGSVQTCVTSPPYYGLRDYQTATWEGGDAACDHSRPAIPHTGLAAAAEISDGKHREASGTRAAKELQPYRDLCGKCGARRIDAQIGLESSPEDYVQKLVDVFREVKRVLRDDGTLWLNLGDSYNSGAQYNAHTGMHKADRYAETQDKQWAGHRPMIDGLKPKDLIGIPWMVAFALRADGWYLRSDIIWHKPNPMPESVTDRPTKAHEYIFLLSKSATYYYDSEAIAESATTGYDLGILRTRQQNLDRNDFNRRQEAIDSGIDSRNGNPSGKRNRRSVWTVATQPYPDSHFATFPEKLIEPCILAGSKVGDTVLDPFAGSGTTLTVSLKHHRNAIGIELNPDYHALMQTRIQRTQPTLLEFA